jgi:phospholipase C
MSTRRALKCVLALSTVLAGTVMFNVSAGAATTTASTSPTGPIKHIIVVMQSGHSYDNYFGTRANANGIPAGVCQIVHVGSTTCVKPYHLNSDQARAGLSDTLHVTQKSINFGKMDQFVIAQPNTAIGSVSMGHLDRSDLPYYWSLADRFSLFDNFYASSQAGSLPNRLAAVAGQDAGLTSNTIPAGGITVPTVFDQLDKAGVSWKYYVEDYKGAGTTPTSGEQTHAPVLAMPAITGTPANATRVVNTSQYFVDLNKGDLPAVSYVSSTVNSERSPQNPARGEAFVRSLVNALMQSSAWKNTELLLTYDDSGGWYDHAAPPTVAGKTLGIRVPAILISPYAKAGHVDSTTMDTASIPALIDTTFKLPPLTAQSAAAGNLSSALDLSQVPIAPVATPGAAFVVIPRPHVVTIYLIYVIAFLIAAALIAYAFIRARRDDSGPTHPASPPELMA